MYWKQHENNMKNCFNIDLKCLIDSTSRMGLAKLFEHKQEVKNTWSFAFCKKKSFKLLLFPARVWSLWAQLSTSDTLWNIAEKDLVSSELSSRLSRNLLID